MRNRYKKNPRTFLVATAPVDVVAEPRIVPACLPVRYASGKAPRGTGQGYAYDTARVFGVSNSQMVGGTGLVHHYIMARR